MLTFIYLAKCALKKRELEKCKLLKVQKYYFDLFKKLKEFN